MWSTVVGSGFRFTVGSQYFPSDPNDGRNTVRFANLGACDHVNGFGRTDFAYDPEGSETIFEADVTMNSNCDWVQYKPSIESEAPGAPGVSFRRGIRHELGHVAGLRHDWAVPSMMHYGDKFERLLGDDHFGIRWLYPAPGSELDLTVVNAKAQPCGDPCPMSFMEWVSPPWPDQLIAGVAILVDFTVDHLGTTWNEVPVISVFLGSHHVGDRVPIVHQWPHTERVNLTVPHTVPRGQYPLRVVVDHGSALAESNELNNELPNPWGEVWVFNAPSVPSELTAIGEAGQINLDWADNTESDVVAYRIDRSALSSVGGFFFYAVSYTSAYTDTHVTPETAYHYRITAVNSDGIASAFSNVVSATASPVVSGPGSPGTDGVSGDPRRTANRLARRPPD